MEQLERHPDLGELFVYPVPIRLHEHTLVFAPAREQQRIHLGRAAAGMAVTADTGLLGV
jgi:hypothetical protein